MKATDLYNHLERDFISNQYFKKYNEANPKHPMIVFDNVNYCLAVKK